MSRFIILSEMGKFHGVQSGMTLFFTPVLILPICATHSQPKHYSYVTIHLIKIRKGSGYIDGKFKI